MQVGVAIKPSTECIAQIEQLVADKLVDMVLVMTVEPGFGGQALIQSALDRVRHLRKRFATLAIEVDGGINANTIDSAAEAGANVVVAGSAVFTDRNPANVIDLLKRSLQHHHHQQD
jgi:ribulose-phosphate 3-epimerase